MSRKDLFRVRATTVMGRMGGAPTPSVLNLEDMLKEAFGTETLVSARGGIGRERVPESGIYHFFKSYGGDGYQHVQQSMLGVLNPWVLGMGEWDRLMLAFELYDFFNKLGHHLSSLISIRTLITIVGFALFIIGIQFVPFANLIVDAIIAFFFVQSVLAVLRMLGSLMMADYYCSNTKSFIDVHLATQELVGMDEDAASALVDICTWGVGKLAKYAKYARDKPPTKIDDIVKEDPIAHGPAKVRDAGKTATERKVTHEKWEEGLDRASRDALEADANAAKAFREMDPEVRRAFTLCSVDCLPVKPVPTQAQIDSVAALLKRTKTKSDNRALREYLKINRMNLDKALKELDKVTTKAALDAFFDSTVIARAKDLGYIAQREGPHNAWHVRTKPGDVPVAEYTIKLHKTQPGTHSRSVGTSFFQSHHGVQGKWAEVRKIPGYIYDEQPRILLRDSRKGTPHQIVNERQTGRKAGRATRKYSDKANASGERDLLIEDMKQAGVPDDIAADLLKQTDDYFAGLYKAAKANGMKPAELADLFGDWKPQMTHPLSKRLLSLSEDTFHHGPPRPPEEMEELEREVGARFPDDYRAVLLEVGPCAIAGPKIQFNVDSISDVVLSLDDDLLIGRMPGIVMIGNDGGDYGYYYDPKGRLGRGAFALYFVEIGDIDVRGVPLRGAYAHRRDRSGPGRRELSRAADARQLSRVY